MSIDTLTTKDRSRLHGGLAAVETAKLLQMRNATLRSCFTRFDEASYRMEHVARINGKEFINDAAARSVNATWYALENTEGGIIWIATADNDNVDYAMLRSVALRKVRMLLCVGSDSSNLRRAFQGVVPVIEDCDSIGEAVNRACYSTIDKAKVIYSPACSDLLTPEMAGEVFRHEVNEL